MDTQADFAAQRPDGRGRRDDARAQAYASSALDGAGAPVGDHAGDHAVHARAAEMLRAHTRDVLDFPEPGIVFKDITPMLGDHAAFTAVVDSLTATARNLGATAVAAIEARGFLLAAPVAVSLGTGIVLIRKKGKLPGATVSESYALEYGTATLEIHDDAVDSGDRVLLVDDVLATGGTAAAAHSLVRKCGADVVGLAVLMELTFLSGRERVAPLPVSTILSI